MCTVIQHPASQAANHAAALAAIVTMDAPLMIAFEVGQKYVTRFACDADTKIYVTVVKRTEKMITVKDDNGRTYSRKLITSYGREMFRTASYSMAPMFSADRKA